MKYTLAMRENGRVSDERQLGTGTVVLWDVIGLPDGEHACIATFDRRWRILRIKNGVQGEWTGEFISAEEAFQSLVDEFTD